MADAGQGHVTYSQRVGGDETTWSIGEDAMIINNGSDSEMRFPWKDVTHIRVYPDPALDRPYVHATRLRFKDGRQTRFDNCHLIDLDTYENRSASYAPFVREVIAKVIKHAPAAMAHTGKPQAAFLLLPILWVVLGAGLIAFAVLGNPDWSQVMFRVRQWDMQVSMLPVAYVVSLIWVAYRTAATRPRRVSLASLAGYDLPAQT